VKFLPFLLQLTPGCQVLLDILAVLLLFKKFPVFYGRQKFIIAKTAAYTERLTQSIAFDLFLQD
jgi:hypothetical protein